MIESKVLLESGEHVVPDAVLDYVENRRHRSTECWPFIAKRYVGLDLRIEGYFRVRLVGLKVEFWANYVAVLTGRGQGETALRAFSGNGGPKPQAIDTDLRH